MTTPGADRIQIGDQIPPVVRTTGFDHWNRYAAVNDEFVPIHMDDEAGRAAGQHAAFGMGNLRIAYLHDALTAWVGDAGGIVEFACQFRGLNFKGDTLTAGGTVTGREVRDGVELVHLALSVENQDGVDTTPGTATVALWGDTGPVVLPDPPPDAPTGAAAPGVYVTAEEIARIGTESEPVAAWPVGVNDIRRWAIATHWPQPAPATFLDEEVAAAGPWGGLVAPRDFNPFAWGPRAMGVSMLREIGPEPGHRILNGGQRSRYFAPIRPGDVITGVSRLVDVTEKETRLGPTSIFSSEQRWTNQRGELVRIGTMTALYY